MLLNDVVDFLANKNKKNSWLYIDSLNLKIYLRRASRYVNQDKMLLEPCIDIGAIEVDEKHRSKGNFTSFMQEFFTLKLSEFKYVYVENVLEDRFAQWFRKNDWQVKIEGGVPSFFKKVGKSI